MAYKVAIDNGHGYNTAGKRTPKMPDGRVIREWEFNHPTAKKLEAELKRCGLQTVMVSDTKDDTPLATRVDRANKAKADIFVSIHYNAFKGVWGSHGGIETFHYPGSTKGKKLAELVQKELVKATGLRNRGVKTNNFYVLRHTKIPAILCECGFMDNLEEAKLMLDEKHQQKVAEAIAKGICSYLGVKYVPKPEPKPQPKPAGNVLYKVQVGAFAQRENAERLANELKKKGYSTYIVKEEK
ncbi:MAG: N-acetylmuramoyl-L-alanine amidase [Caldicoprobacterales bacterium]